MAPNKSALFIKYIGSPQVSDAALQHRGDILYMDHYLKGALKEYDRLT
jgi:hypothetical protein